MCIFKGERILYNLPNTFMNYFDPNQPQQTAYNQVPYNKSPEHQKPFKKKKNVLNSLFSTPSLIAFIFILNLVSLGFIIKNEIAINNNPETKYARIIAKVSKQQLINPGTQVYVEELRTVDTLKNENEIQKEIYKDAQNGDYAVLIPENKLIIYRESEDKIIYNDVTPNAKVQGLQTEQVKTIRSVAINANLIQSDSTTIPQLSLVQQPDTVKQQDQEFYRDVQAGDIIAYFGTENIIFIYRPSTQSILNSGSTRLQISR